MIGSWSDAAVYDGGDGSGIALLKGLGVAVGGAAVTPSDSTDLSFVARGLWVGGAGDVKVTTANGDTITLSGVQAGTLIPVAVSRVFATLTTATLIVALK